MGRLDHEAPHFLALEPGSLLYVEIFFLRGQTRSLIRGTLGEKNFRLLMGEKQFPGGVPYLKSMTRRRIKKIGVFICNLQRYYYPDFSFSV